MGSGLHRTSEVDIFYVNEKFTIDGITFLHMPQNKTVNDNLLNVKDKTDFNQNSSKFSRFSLNGISNLQYISLKLFNVHQLFKRCF